MPLSNPFSRFTSAVLAVSLTLQPILLCAKDAELSFPGDITAPSIERTSDVSDIVAGSSWTFEAEVRDPSGVKEVVMFFRRAGDHDFKPIIMKSMGGGLYIAIFAPEDVTEPGIEYYLKATDTAGNSVLKGVSFSPLIVNVSPLNLKLKSKPVSNQAGLAAVTLPQIDADTDSGEKEEGMSMWAIVGGVVAAGLLVGGSGGGGGGGGGGGSKSGAVTFGGTTP